MSAFDGIRVICLGQFYFAPYCSMMLARMGAEVIKVEALQGDPYRRLASADGSGTSMQFTMLNSGKRAMRLDLRCPEGQEVLRRLAETADVLVQNLSPGAMDRFGIGWETMRRVNPRLIMASGTGFGSFGPYAGQPAMDLTVQARSAIMSTTGSMDGPPTRTGPSVVDFTAGAHMFGGVVTALYQRERTGLGQHVEVALQDAIIPSLCSNIAGHVNTGGRIPERTGNRHGGLSVSPYNAYRTSDGWVTLLCPTEGHWAVLRELMGDFEALDDRFASMEGRCAHNDEVDAIVGRWTRGMTKAGVAEALSATSIPNSPVVGIGDLLEDEHVAARGVLRWMDDDDGSWMTIGSPLFLSGSPMVEPTRPRSVGQDTDSILMGDLGMTEEEVSALREAGVI
ncbi:CaiB/BaiF CoA transferase family protein [Nocardiopsis synnemataformans]|uniref:CaiB/BaiF CoA transferase family protein n=1 Tax=Nocardiopsis synnemataformans TaxID=61305 RepID=UPI003EC0D6E9